MRLAGLLAALCLATATCRPAGAGNEAEPVELEQAGPKIGVVRVQVAGDEWATIGVELATTPEAQARGLMWREQLSEDEGMLFIFPRESIRSFWMKNTLIPLDMVFIDETGRIVGIVHEAEPLTLVSRSVGRPSRYVLELQGGWARSRGLEEGHRVRFEGVPGVAEPFGSAAD